MAGTKTLSDQGRQRLIGMSLPPVTLEVEKGHIRRFAEAIEDGNPLWTDEAAGGIMAPPTFLRVMMTEAPTPPELTPFPQMLDGGSEWEYMAPVRPGDAITAVTRFASVNQRTISVGPAVFLVLETDYTNQRGEAVARQRSTLIRY